MGNLGIIAYHDHDLSLADKLFRESIQLFTEESAGLVPTDSFLYLGHSLLVQGRLDKAAAQYQELIDIMQTTGTATIFCLPLGINGRKWYWPMPTRSCRRRLT